MDIEPAYDLVSHLFSPYTLYAGLRLNRPVWERDRNPVMARMALGEKNAQRERAETKAERNARIIKEIDDKRVERERVHLLVLASFGSYHQEVLSLCVRGKCKQANEKLKIMKEIFQEHIASDRRLGSDLKNLKIAILNMNKELKERRNRKATIKIAKPLPDSSSFKLSEKQVNEIIIRDYGSIEEFDRIKEWVNEVLAVG